MPLSSPHVPWPFLLQGPHRRLCQDRVLTINNALVANRSKLVSTRRGTLHKCLDSPAHSVRSENASLNEGFSCPPASTCCCHAPPILPLHLVSAVDIGSNAARLLISRFDPWTGAFSDVARVTKYTGLGKGLTKSVSQHSSSQNSGSHEASLHPPQSLGLISQGTLDRTLGALKEISYVINQHCCPRISSHVRVCATSAARRASNFSVVARAAESFFGTEVEVISGEEEARLSFLGASSALALGSKGCNSSMVDSHASGSKDGESCRIKFSSISSTRIPNMSPMPVETIATEKSDLETAAGGRVFVLDIGGGSTELSFGDSRGLQAAVSVELGSRSMTEMFFGEDDEGEGQSRDPTGWREGAVKRCLAKAKLEMASCMNQLRESLQWEPAAALQSTDGHEVHLESCGMGSLRTDVLHLGPAGPVTAVGTGGIITTIAAMVQGQDYSRDIVHMFYLSKKSVQHVLHRCSSLSLEERLQLPGMWEGQAKVILGGCCLLLAVMEVSSLETLIVSENDILDGMVISMKQEVMEVVKHVTN